MGPAVFPEPAAGFEPSHVNWGGKGKSARGRTRPGEPPAHSGGGGVSINGKQAPQQTSSATTVPLGKLALRIVVR